MQKQNEIWLKFGTVLHIKDCSLFLHKNHMHYFYGTFESCVIKTTWTSPYVFHKRNQINKKGLERWANDNRIFLFVCAVSLRAHSNWMSVWIWFLMFISHFMMESMGTQSRFLFAFMPLPKEKPPPHVSFTCLNYCMLNLYFVYLDGWSKHNQL